MLRRGVNNRWIARLPPHPECRLLLGTAIAADQSDGNSHTPSVLPQRSQKRNHRWCDAYACGITGPPDEDRKSTRLNSSHITISYAVFCLKKKKKKKITN